MNYFDTVISCFDTIISVICAILTGIGAWYGRKAYLEARKIFNDGLKLNSDKVLSQVGYEFVYTFIIPYLDFCSSSKKLWEIVPQSMSIQYVLYILNSRIKFSVDFQCWEKHKTDVWGFLYDDSMAKNGRGNIYITNANYRRINNFVNSAKEFCYSIDILEKGLRAFIVKRPNASLQDYINNSNKYLLSLGKQQMDNIILCINSLPSKLLVKELIADQSGPNKVLTDWLGELNVENI